MALLKTITLPTGQIASDAYHKVTEVRVKTPSAGLGGLDVQMGPPVGGAPSECWADIKVSSYVNEAACDNYLMPIQERNYHLDAFDRSDNSATVVALIYAWLKTQPDFDGATDA